MAKCKKVLSVVLCFAMLLGTLTVGLLSVSAAESYDLPAYSDLVTKYAGEANPKFFYAGVTLKDNADGSLVEDMVYPGEVVDVSFYTKSNYDVYKSIYWIVLDGSVFSFVTNSASTGLAANGSTVSVAKSNAKTAGCYKTVSKVDTVDAAFSSYTVDQMNKWLVIKVTNANPATTIRNTKGDDPLVSFKVKVNDSVTASDTGLGCHVKLFPELFSCYNGTVYGNNACCLDSSSATTAVAAHFELSSPRTFSVASTVSFVDSDGTTKLLDDVTVGSGSSINLDSYVPTVEGKTFKQWSVNGVAVSGSITVNNNITAKAIWEGETPENAINIMIPDGEGDWKAATTVSGTSGEYLTKVQIDAATNYVNSNYTFDAGIEGAEVSASALSKINASGSFTSIKGGEESGKDDVKVKFGSAENGGSGITELYIPVSFKSVKTYYTPTFNEDGTIDETAWVAHASNPIEFKTNTDGDFVYSNTTFDTYAASFAVGEIGESEIDTDYYNISYVDGNGNAHQVGAGSTYVSLNASDRTAGTTNFDLYVTPVFRDFWVSITITGNERIIARQKVTFDDEISSDVLDDFFNLNAGLSGESINLEGLYEDGEAVGKKGSKLINFTFSVDGEVIFHSERKEGKTIVVDSEGNPVVIDPDTLGLDGFKGSALIGGSFSDTVNFTANWEEKENEFIVMYQDGDNGWKELTRKTLSGNATVDDKALLDEDLKEIINNNNPTGQVAIDTIFTYDGSNTEESKAINLHAYDGPLTLYVFYTADKVYAYADFNNTRYDADKNITTPGTAEVSSANYGTVVYNPDRNIFDTVTEEEATTIPYFNSFLIGFRPTSSPAVEYRKDKDGNILYSDLVQPKVKLDKDGNPETDPKTGEPVYETDATGSIIYETVMTDELDKDGNPTGNKVPVPDTSKPIVASDPKGNDSNRPYRNCEYVGYKFYYVEGIYKDWSSVMAKKDEWKEGFENSDYSEKACTAILQIQWKSDADFKYRVYDSNGNIYSAKGRDGKTYFWNSNKPCEKSKAIINGNPIRIDEDGNLTGQFLLMFSKKTETAKYNYGETGESKYYTTRFLGVANLHPRFLPDLFPTIINLIKGLL